MRDEKIYIVSGYMRSGTSMMMKCLEASGMNACYNLKKDRVLNDKYEREDYSPNPDGFFELGRKEFKDPLFTQKYRGKLIKVLHWRLDSLPDAQYRVVFIKRDPKEIEVSYLKMFQRRPPFVLRKYEELVEETIGKLEKRGINTDIVHFSDVIEKAESVFTLLKREGWPLDDIDAAAKSVKLKLYRSKAEKLDEVRKRIPGLITDLPHELL